MGNAAFSTKQLIFDNITATTLSSAINTDQYDDIYLILVGSNTPNWNIKFKTGELTGVDYSAASTPANVWTYINSKNTSSDAAIDGATGITINTTQAVRVRINDFWCKSLVIDATRTAGNLTAWIEGVRK